MYLAGLSRFPGEGDPFSPEFYTVNVGIDPDDCRARGGIPNYTDSTRTNPTASELIPYAQRQQKVRTWTCQVPVSAPPPSAPITISVPTSVQTAVSPQVSPVFVQQDEPQNSPVSAGTVQASPSPMSTSQSPVPQGSSVDTRNAMFDDYLQKMMEQSAADAARQQALLDSYAADAARQQALLDSYAAKSSPVNYGSVSAPSLGPSVAMPEYPTPVTAGPVDHSLRNGLLVAVAGVALSAYISRRGKSSGARRSRKRK